MASNLIPPEALLDPALVASKLSSPPFVSVEGVFNIRDFGAGYPSSLSSGSRIKPLHLFRSGEPSRITPKGVGQLRALGIRKIFDLRSQVEIAKYGSANAGLEDVTIVRAPILEEAMDPVGIAKRLKAFADNEAEAFFRMNTHILKSGGPALEQVLVHLRDRPEEPCLVHCTAGKDRSGMFAAVVLMLLGAHDEDIIADYTLTTVGLQPVLPLLVARFQQEDVYRDNWQGTLNVATAKPQSIKAILEMIRDEFGGAEGFVLAHTSLTADDLARIRENLLVTPSAATP